jgi:hypothetical protein
MRQLRLPERGLREGHGSDTVSASKTADFSEKSPLPQIHFLRRFD